jgi:hypothetical protein
MGTPAAAPEAHAFARNGYRSGSWMRPEVKSEDLLYVPLDSGNPSENNSIVNVFSWKKASLGHNLRVRTRWHYSD